MALREASSVRPALAGRIMLGIGTVGVLLSLAGTVVGWQLLGELHAGMGQSLQVTSDVLETMDESFVVAEDSLAILAEGVAGAEAAVRSLSSSMGEGQEALSAAADLAGGEVADAIESVEEGLPAVEAAADTIDDTLGALSAVPILPFSYEPARPLGESVGALREDLVGLPEELREQAAQVERTSAEMVAATEATLATAESLQELEVRLGDASALIAEYGAEAEEARLLVDEELRSLAASTRRARLMVLAFGLVFALGQFVPLYLGQALHRGGGAGLTER